MRGGKQPPRPGFKAKPGAKPMPGLKRAKGGGYKTLADRMLKEEEC